MKIRSIVIGGLLMLMAFCAYGQVASISPDQITYSAAARAGQHEGFNVAGVVDDIGLFGRSLGRAWDVGTEYRVLRTAAGSSDGAAIFDLGATGIYGSAGGKFAGEAGIIVGDASDCLVWAKGILGNFRAAAAGTQIGRVAISGAYGNYFENRGDIAVALDKKARYVLTAGWSSALGWNGGLKLNFARDRP